VNLYLRLAVPLMLAAGSFSILRADDTPATAPQMQPQPAPSASADYVLGPGDLISVTVPDLDDQLNPNTDRMYRIDMSGNVLLPFVGELRAAGLSAPGLASEIAAGLAGKILKNPHVVVMVTEFHSQPVSVFGEVTTAGLHQLVGNKTLFEALAVAGGFTDNLGSTITITREAKWGSIPLPNAHPDPTSQFSVASLSIKAVLKANDPSANIPLMPDDVITVSRSEVVYAVGSFVKPGGFDLGQNDSLTALQVVSLASGLVPTAAPERAVILRQVPQSKERLQIALNVKQLMLGKGTDVPLQADDILFVPNSKIKSVTYRTIESAVQAATGMAIYGTFGRY
jgi:polysaccharide export outer membrane protein